LASLAHPVRAVAERNHAHPAAPLLTPVDAALGPAAPLRHRTRLARSDCGVPGQFKRMADRLADMRRAGVLARPRYCASDLGWS